ncbi:MAG: signal peptidase I [Chloroflexi bacterium]|nr:signal peptidase I [Chloroflexota bacterium]
MIVKWLLSHTVRQAVQMHHQVRRIVNEQRDLLSAEAIEAVSAANRQLHDLAKSGADKKVLLAQMTVIEDVAQQWLKPYPHGTIRENVKEVQLAVTVILGLTTFFLQLTKIPTGSMQPTLFGVTYENLKNRPDFTIPNGLVKFANYWMHGVSFIHVIAKSEGELRQIEPPKFVFPFVKKQRFLVGNQWYTAWFPPDRFLEWAGLYRGQFFAKGEDIVKMKVVSGDHLLVDRLTYNFRRPKRGEIIVFKTKGVNDLPQDQLYIKRLVALGNETVQIGDDRHLIINGRRLDAATSHFEFVYAIGSNPKENDYLGHVNGVVAAQLGKPSLAPLFPNETESYTVGADQYLAMGDNTLNSYDSRSWGGLPQRNVIGKCWFVYWPITDRFGWGTR